MVESLWHKMHNTNVYRIDVAFDIPHEYMSTFIGRTAHLLFLHNEAFLKMLVHRYQEVFT